MTAEQAVGQVLLSGPVPLMAVRVVVTLPVAKPFGVAAGIHQMNGNWPATIRFNLLQNVKVNRGRVGFGSRGQVKGRFHNWIDAFRQTDVFEVLSSCVGNQYAKWISQTDVFTGQNDQAAQDKARIFAGIQHFCQPIKRRVRVAAAYRLDES